MITDYIPARVLRSRDELLLKMPKCKTEMGKKSFRFSGPFIWNALPYSLRFTIELSKFKADLKTFYFKEAFKQYMN